MKYNDQNHNRARTIIGFVTISTLALGGIALGEFGTQTAMASDNKVISGHACAPQGDDISTDRSNFTYLRSLRVGAQTYMCPVVRDDTTGNLDFVRVRTFNSNTDAVSPRCTVYAVSVDGGSNDSETQTTANLGFNTLAFDLNNFTEYDQGHYVIQCILGRNDRIYSYRTNED